MFFLNSFINNNLTLNTPVQKKRRLHIAFFRTDHYLLNNDGDHGVVRDDGGDDGDAEVVVEAHNDNHDTDDNNSEMAATTGRAYEDPTYKPAPPGPTDTETSALAGV